MARTQPLSTTAKLGFGTAELGQSAAEFFIQVYLLKFYADTVGLAPAIAGLVLALAVLWDAVTDPIMGTLSDRTRLAMGKRRPYIAIGGLALALTFILLFSPPTMTTVWAKALYLLIGYVLVNTAMTLIGVPHYALAGDLAPGGQGRSQLFGIRFLFSNVGLLLGIVVPGVVTAMAGEDLTPAVRTARTAWIIAAAILISAIITLLATRGLDSPNRAPVRSFWPQFRDHVKAVMRNRLFRPLLAAYVVGTIGRTLNASIALFYYEYRLQLKEDRVFLLVLLPFTLVIAISIVGWLKIADRWQKKQAALAGILTLGILGSFAYPLFPPNALAGPIAAAIIGGFLVGSVFLLDAMVSDVADVDKALTGKERDGLYFGFWRMGSKIARALGLVLSGLLLDSIGFREGAAQQDISTQTGLAWIFGPGVGLCFTVAALILICLSLDETKNDRVRKILSWRKRRSQGNIAA